MSLTKLNQYLDKNPVIREDLKAIHENLSPREIDKLKNSTVLITGCGGFLGYYFVHYFAAYAEELNIKKIICLENFITGNRSWLNQLSEIHDKIDLIEFNIIQDDLLSIPNIEDVNFVIHLASIASPVYYRIYPLETLDSNIIGLRRLLDLYSGKESLKGFIFFSSSEIYGDPFPEFIPTDEEYRGNVKTMGPRACYDEAKRFGETLCYVINEVRKIPITIARPFNNYGPGMNIEDKRLPADMAKAIIEGRDLQIFSDGSPTRTFCYVSDSINGYLKVLLYDKLEAFNIGIEKPEISVREFSDLFLKHGREIFNYKGKITFKKSADNAYLTDNPNRRCPKIDKARKLLNYDPKVYVDEGIGRFLTFLKYNLSK